jgi:thymidylate synthase (FAD)
METCNVNLVSMTKPMGELDHLSAEELIAYTARVSNPANQMNQETAPKLLAYCIRNKHWSIFEQVNMTVEITTSRAIAAQILRHRSFSFQEFSQRYAEVTEFIEYPARRQDDKNRQNSVDDLTQPVKDWFQRVQVINNSDVMHRYKTALENGIAKEQARFLLPLSTQTTLYMCGSIRSWIHYIELRSSNGTQLEHREIALKCREIFKTHFPSVAEAMEWT